MDREYVGIERSGKKEGSISESRQVLGWRESWREERRGGKVGHIHSADGMFTRAVTAIEEFKLGEFGLVERGVGVRQAKTFGRGDEGGGTEGQLRHRRHLFEF